MLYTHDKDRLLSQDKRTKSFCRGVFDKDELPTRMTTSSLYICNTDPSTKGGDHWLAIYFDSKRRGELFDSFGMLRFLEGEFVRFLDCNSVSWIRNTKKVQHLLSDACGCHCILYSVYRCVGFDMNAIINRYTNNFMYNDSIVKSFVLDYIQ